MMEQKTSCPPPSPAQLMLRHVICPECGSEKAVVAASHFDEAMSFCPACEAVWRCETPLTPPFSSPVIAVKKPIQVGYGHTFQGQQWAPHTSPSRMPVRALLLPHQASV